jgi:hypothetical protein
MSNATCFGANLSVTVDTLADSFYNNGMAIECFVIKWTRLFPFNKALTQPEAKEGGVYALYKAKASNKKLHYVGKTKDFETRFSSHKQSATHLLTGNELKRCYVAFGIISSFETNRLTGDITPEQLRIVENFFIVILRPEGNSESTKKRYTGNYPIFITNIGIVTKPFTKFMSQNSALLKFLGKPVNTKRRVSTSDDIPWA